MLKIAGKAPAAHGHDGQRDGGVLGRALRRGRAADPRHARRAAGSSCSSSASRRSARWRCSTPSTSRSSCCPSTTSRSCRSSSTCRRAPRSRTPTASLQAIVGARSPTCRRSSRSRPMPAPPRRSTSTASCATTTCAPRRELGDVQVNLTPKGERERASHDIALDMRERLAGARRARRAPRQGGRAAAGAAGAGDAAGRDLRPRRRDPPRRRREGARGLRSRALHRRCRRQLRRSRAARCASTIDQDNLEFYRVEERDVYDTLAHRSTAARRSATRTAAAAASRSRSASRWPKGDRVLDERLLTTPVPANALPGDRGVVELGDVVQRRRRSRRPSRSSATTAAPPRW